MEACEFTAQLRDFERLDAEVVGVSPDSTVVLTDFREKHRLLGHLLSDPAKTVLRAYGAWGVRQVQGREIEGVIRSTFLIDPNGDVAHHWSAVRAEGHAAQVREKLVELRGAK